MNFQKGFERFDSSWIGKPFIQVQSPFHKNRTLTYNLSKQQVHSLLVYCFIHPWELNNKETERELFIGFNQSPLICYKEDLGYFYPTVHGRYFNINETPFIITPQRLDLKDDKPHTIEFDIDFSKETEGYGNSKLIVSFKKPSV